MERLNFLSAKHPPFLILVLNKKINKLKKNSWEDGGTLPKIVLILPRIYNVYSNHIVSVIEILTF